MKNTLKKMSAQLLAVMMLTACSAATLAETVYNPGTYVGKAAGFSGNVTATVTVSESEITGLTIDESENPNQILGDDQREEYAQSIIDAQTPLVDTMTGATITTSAVIEAVKDALTQAGATEFEAAEKKTYSAEEISFTPGVYSSTKMGMNGEITVEVQFTENRIEAISVVDHKETTGVGTAAMNILTDHILDNQSLGADMISGATYTSMGFMAAVKDCVEQADGNVDALASFPVHYDNYAEKTHDADVIIVGGGVAGMMTALSSV